VNTTLSARYSYCKTNAVGYDNTDKPNFCSAQALLIAFAAVGTAMTWAMLAIDLFLKVVVGYRSTQKFRLLFLGIPILITGALLVLGSQNRYGAIGQLPFCFVVRDGDLGVVYIPILVGTVVGACCMGTVVFTIVRSIIRTREQSVSVLPDGRSFIPAGESAAMAVVKKFHMIRIPLAFILEFIFVLAAYQTFRWSLYRNYYALVSSAQDFTACVFKAYDGTNGWKSSCGPHPGKRISPQFSGFALFCVAGQSIMLGSIYLLNPSVWTYWGKCLGVVLGTKLLSKYGLASHKGDSSSGISDGGHSIVWRRGMRMFGFRRSVSKHGVKCNQADSERAAIVDSNAIALHQIALERRPE